MILDEIQTPAYVVYEDKLRRNIELIKSVARQADVEIIMAFKANALWRTFPIFREYGVKATASSLNELHLACEELCDAVHTYCPAYTEATIEEYLNGSSHITFNSLSQAERFLPAVKARGGKVSAGLRVNPRCSVIETDLYNPALPGSRFGVSIEDMPAELPDGIEGFHFHALCESDAEDLQKVIEAFEAQFGKYLPKLKWVNMGGGHLMTRKGYNVDLLVSLLQDFKRRHPNLHVILEPGSAWTWRTGDLITSVVDIVENQGVKTAIIDASFACHMPDTLEMPYQPTISESTPGADYSYRLGGNSCLSGDYVGDWQFDRPLRAGQRLTLEDMNHYTTVKTTMFNGIHHPSIVLCRADGECEILREFTYQDYKSRMS
ncbi:MAG: carboxynorspermidine decarboxylase [Bacteroides sp.]|nr:carboxynorspermidine decarboxylase [Bacteroides sp.]MCM1379160.1 carboxynorspermidine decarboxylase [Bacteroides sp.]MCM1445191.1 carboxynorspermidine decarboxylase [Prevotella sp.]